MDCGWWGVGAPPVGGVVSVFTRFGWWCSGVGVFGVWVFV
jgi:hypothetical protein